METETITAPIRPDLADESVAGRPFPLFPVGTSLTHATAAQHLLALHRWWTDAASGWTDVAASANANGCPAMAGEAIVDAKRCLAAAARYAPTGGAR